MKVTSAYANKLIRGYREELAALISSEKDTCTTVYGASETPIETGYDFSSTQAEMDALNDKIVMASTFLTRPRSWKDSISRSMSPSFAWQC